MHEIIVPGSAGKHADKALGESQVLRYADDLSIMYRREKARRRELQAANARMAAMMSAVGDGVAYTDEALTVRSANEVFCAMFDLAPELLAETRITSLSGAQPLGASVAAKQEPGEHSRVSIAGPKGRSLDVDATRVEGGYVFVFHDVSARKRAENLKREFLAIVSHELRTPLNGILGFAALLQDELDGEQAEGLACIEQSGRRMMEAVEELLRFADLQGRGLDSLDERVEVADVLHQAVENVAPQAEGRGVRIDLEPGGDVGEMEGNRAMLTELFTNLVRNAVQFNARGGTVALRAAGGAGGIVVEIEDDGPGIPATELDRVFDSFYQVEGFMTRENEGLGLGLTIASRVAGLHGGEVSLEPSVAGGVLARVRLPAKAPGNVCNL